MINDEIKWIVRNDNEIKSKKCLIPSHTRWPPNLIRLIKLISSIHPSHHQSRSSDCHDYFLKLSPSPSLSFSCSPSHIHTRVNSLPLRAGWMIIFCLL